jgi:general secretion pathway protein D
MNNRQHSPASAAFRLMTAIVFLGLLGVSPTETRAQTSAEAVMQKEQIRRQEIILKAIMEIEATEVLIKEGKMDEARTRLAEILKNIPNQGEAAPAYNKAASLLNQIELATARKALEEKDWFGARDAALAALGYSPENPEASAILATVNDRLGIENNDESTMNPAVDRKFVNNLNKMNELIEEGKNLKATGQFKEAEKAFNQALIIDPYNKVAAKELSKLYRERRVISEIARRSSKQEKLTGTREGWSLNVATERAPELAKTETNPIRRSTNFALAQKLNSILIPQVNFEQASLEDVATFLTNKTRELDPDGIGVSVLLKNASVSAGSKPVSLQLSNIPAGEVLRYITNLAGVKFRVEEYAVFIVPLADRTDVVITREFPVRPAFFDVAPTGGGSGAPAGGRRTPIGTPVSPTSGSESTRSVLETRGVDFSAEGAAAFYNQATGILTVKNTQDQIDLVEELVIGQSVESLIVRVDTKVVEINQTDLNSLAFNATLAANPAALVSSGGTAFGSSSVGVTTNNQGVAGLKASDAVSSLLGAPSAIEPLALTTNTNKFGIAGVLEGNAFRILLEALSQKDSFDLMTAPSIMINDGAQGTITVAREFYYPTEFDEAQVTPATVSNTTIVVPAWPTEFQARNVGVVLTAQPRITVDRQRVFLTLKPDITEFDGFINYGSRIFSTRADSLVFPFDVPEGTTIADNIINQPIFSVRAIENAQLEIQDGYTMVLGGLIREDISTIEEKIPILGDIPLMGRLFRSKAEQSIKRNLMIFVSVRILRPDGEPYNLAADQGR